MPKPEHHREIEIKLRVPDIFAVRSRLRQLRAKVIQPRTYEMNTLYDTARNELKRRGQLIRIRIEQPSLKRRKPQRRNDAEAILTYKGPSRSGRAASPANRRANHAKPYKVRSEAEISINGAAHAEMILRALGLRPVFRYEKFRTTYALPAIRGLKVELDETPIGTYLELEGPIAGINRAARLLGYAEPEFVTETYGSLYLSDCRRRGRKPSHMLFGRKKIERTFTLSLTKLSAPFT